MKNLTKKHLLQALKDAGFANGYDSLLRFEELGVIESAERRVFPSGRSYRVYSQKDIDKAVGNVKKYYEGTIETKK